MSTGLKNANATDKMLEKEKEIQNDFMEGFISGSDNQIYEFLTNIAKRKYSKYENIKQIQEEFYQKFIKMDNYTYKMNNEELHDKLLEYRINANKKIKNTKKILKN
jgi:flagellar capping protein FliD